MNLYPDYIEAGESRLRHLADPVGELPAVSLRRMNACEQSNIWAAQLEGVENFVIERQGLKIGRAHIRQFPSEGEACFADISMDRTSKHYIRGAGRAAYILTAETTHRLGMKFVSDGTISEQAKKVWEDFCERGVAEIVNTFELEDPGDGVLAAMYAGRAVVLQAN